MVTRLVASLVALAVAAASYGQEQAAADTRSGAVHPAVRTVRGVVNGDDQRPPVLALGGGDVLEVSWDELSTDRRYMRYELVHCTADWRPSGLVESETVGPEGFNRQDVEDYRFSRATSAQYVHYAVRVPTPQMAPAVSGNYLLRVYDEADPDQTLLQYRFMVAEQTAPLSVEVATATDVDYNDAHQQLAVRADLAKAGVRDPMAELRLAVLQDGRQDPAGMAWLPRPSRTVGPVAVWEHQPELIFDAGNEYRRMETVSTRFPTMGVEEIGYRYPYYTFLMRPDQPRAGHPYVYDKTQHGGMRVHEYNSADPDVEADYGLVRLTLRMPRTPGGEAVYVEGDLTGRRLDRGSMMAWDPEEEAYVKDLLLKQGAYNYQYVLSPSGEAGPVEGDHYQASHRYLVLLYHRAPGSRYDRLLEARTVETVDR